MTKATLGEMHLTLMEQLQRLNECESGSDEMREEICRSEAMSGLAKQVVANASLMVKTSQLVGKAQSVPPMLVEGK